MRIKTCKKCNSLFVNKFWFKRWKQRYKCKKCGYIFQNKSRNRENKKIWDDYTIWKQTYQELSKRYWKSILTIQRKLDHVLVKKKI